MNADAKTTVEGNNTSAQEGGIDALQLNALSAEDAEVNQVEQVQTNEPQTTSLPQESSHITEDKKEINDPTLANEQSEQSPVVEKEALRPVAQSEKRSFFAKLGGFFRKKPSQKKEGDKDGMRLKDETSPDASDAPKKTGEVERIDQNDYSMAERADRPSVLMDEEGSTNEGAVDHAAMNFRDASTEVTESPALNTEEQAEPPIISDSAEPDSVAPPMDAAPKEPVVVEPETSHSEVSETPDVIIPAAPKNDANEAQQDIPVEDSGAGHSLSEVPDAPQETAMPAEEEISVPVGAENEEVIIRKSIDRRKDAIRQRITRNMEEEIHINKEDMEYVDAINQAYKDSLTMMQDSLDSVHSLAQIDVISPMVQRLQDVMYDKQVDGASKAKVMRDFIQQQLSAVEQASSAQTAATHKHAPREATQGATD